MHRNPEIRVSMEIRETLTTLLVQVRNVYWLFELSLSTRGERATIFTMLTVPSDPTNASSSFKSQLASPSFGSQLVSHSFGSQLASSSVRSQLTVCLFFQNHHESQPIASGHDVIRTLVSFLIWGFYYDICDSPILRARPWTPALNV